MRGGFSGDFTAYDSIAAIEARKPVPVDHLKSGESRLEPLSNGLRLDMTRAQVEARFGRPEGKPSDMLRYGGAAVEFGTGDRIISVLINDFGSDPQLHCNIGPRSTREQVRAALGPPNRDASVLSADAFQIEGWRIFVATAPIQRVTPRGGGGRQKRDSSDAASFFRKRAASHLSRLRTRGRAQPEARSKIIE